MAYLPKRSLVKRFMDDVIHPAMTLVQEELNKQGTISHISDAVDDRIRLEVDLGNELNFIYEVRLRGYSSPTFALAAMDDAEIVVALGPGFTAGVVCHAVVETMRGDTLGRV